MHIVFYHDARIPPLKYGGTERLIGWLAKALLLLGHQVTLLAQAESHVPGAQVIPLNPQGDWQDLIPTTADFLHLWNTPRTLPKLPFLITIGGNGQINETYHPNTVFVSRKHAENHGCQSYVHNGIDPDDYLCDEQRENYVVFLAKASWKVKNLKGAVQVARAALIPLKVMGSRDLPFGLSHWVPTWQGVSYYGMLNDQEKRQILRKAKALIFPVRWHEPFGLAVTEALASGCPVFGTPYGSLPEIITPETGVLSNRMSELVQALQTRTFSPQTCRQRVFQGFTHLQMAESYVQLYQKVLTQGYINSKNINIRYLGTQSAETLLPWESVATKP